MMKLPLIPYFHSIFVHLIMLEKIVDVCALLCHRTECTSTLGCTTRVSAEMCTDNYCYMLLAKNITNPDQFTLRRGCIGDPAEISYSNELDPFKMLNQCQRIVWKDIEFLLKICADRDYCNFCESWAEAVPTPKSSAIGFGTGATSLAFLGTTIFSMAAAVVWKFLWFSVVSITNGSFEFPVPTRSFSHI